jgi:hypothetical protein
MVALAVRLVRPQYEGFTGNNLHPSEDKAARLHIAHFSRSSSA